MSYSHHDYMTEAIDSSSGYISVYQGMKNIEEHWKKGRKN